MAFSKKHKNSLIDQYTDWLQKSEGVFFIEYSHMSVKDVEDLRRKAREAGGEAHVVKNTLLKKAMDQAGFTVKGDFEKTTLAGFAFRDAPAMAKVFSDASKSDIFSLKSGYLTGAVLDAKSVSALANLPPLPIMRSNLLSLIQAPAGQLVRTLAEPARSLAFVFKAYSEKGAEA